MDRCRCHSLGESQGNRLTLGCEKAVYSYELRAKALCLHCVCKRNEGSFIAASLRTIHAGLLSPYVAGERPDKRP